MTNQAFLSINKQGSANKYFPIYLQEQGIYRISAYPSNLLEHGNKKANNLEINLSIVTKYRTLTIPTKNYEILIREISNFSTLYNITGLVGYVEDNYYDLIYIDQETLKEYYEIEIQMKEFEDIGNLAWIYSEKVDAK